MNIPIITAIGKNAISLITQIGSLVLFTLSTIRHIFSLPVYFKECGNQMIRIGFFSVPVVGMTAIFTGAVLVLQSYTGFVRFSAETTIPTVVVISLTRELGPVLAGLMVAGRVGSSIAAEIATMKVTEQVDALFTLSINPMKYLVAPRVIASVLVLPILVLIADIIGIAGGYLVATEKLGFNPGLYLQNTIQHLTSDDIMSGVIKAAIFGFIIAISGCYNGYNAKKGAAGVGVATINAVVMASILILFSNYITTQLLFVK